MVEQQTPKKSLTVSILSLSLLTVMAGAAVAPALSVIQEHFAASNAILVQMIISIPAIFIVMTSLVFPKLCQLCRTKTLVLLGLLLYTVGGCAAGAFDQIWLVLLMRALVGIGVGIIMPLSTGLLAYYYQPERQAALMGYSSAMNQLGGVIATLLAGVLANVSWRASFLVYLMGLFSILLCLFFLPNDSITVTAGTKARPKPLAIWQTSYTYIIAMFLLMSTFFIYPANFALETVREGIIPQQYIAIIMAMMDFIALLGGLLFVRCRQLLRAKTRFLAPTLFLIGYLLLLYPGGWCGTLAGSAFIGFANGAGIPFIIAEASLRAGQAAATTVMPLISAALYLAQFLSPILMGAVTALCGAAIMHLPYYFALALAIIFLLWSTRLPQTAQ